MIIFIHVRDTEHRNLTLVLDFTKKSAFNKVSRVYTSLHNYNFHCITRDLHNIIPVE